MATSTRLKRFVCATTCRRRTQRILAMIASWRPQTLPGPIFIWRQPVRDRGNAVNNLVSEVVGATWPILVQRGNSNPWWFGKRRVSVMRCPIELLAQTLCQRLRRWITEVFSVTCARVAGGEITNPTRRRSNVTTTFPNTVARKSAHDRGGNDWLFESAERVRCARSTSCSLQDSISISWRDDVEQRWHQSAGQSATITRVCLHSARIVAVAAFRIGDGLDWRRTFMNDVTLFSAAPSCACARRSRLARVRTMLAKCHPARTRRAVLGGKLYATAKCRHSNGLGIDGSSPILDCCSKPATLTRSHARPVDSGTQCQPMNTAAFAKWMDRHAAGKHQHDFLLTRHAVPLWRLRYHFLHDVPDPRWRRFLDRTIGAPARRRLALVARWSRSMVHIPQRASWRRVERLHRYQ